MKRRAVFNLARMSKATDPLGSQLSTIIIFLSLFLSLSLSLSLSHGGYRIDQPSHIPGFLSLPRFQGGPMLRRASSTSILFVMLNTSDASCYLLTGAPLVPLRGHFFFFSVIPLALSKSFKLFGIFLSSGYVNFIKEKVTFNRLNIRDVICKCVIRKYSQIMQKNMTNFIFACIVF
jgi:hypothetical protein